MTEFNPAILLNTWSALTLTSPSFEIMDRRVDDIRVEAGGLAQRRYPVRI